ncbi:methyltransferase domain-containing protein [Candidatus Uabimicrobium sp. HlEnr_7]|uniref:methyltransferase domain-containing protein n=1 Tax=Candidatus Uabimicrobium helgolandensis TaxID=3095367 RepID=UPI0035576F8E
MSNEILNNIQQYYGQILNTKDDLKTNACCTADVMPEYLRPLVRNIHPQVQDKFYGCGSPIPLNLESCTVLDLGSGSGRDSYLFSKLVGESGNVIGIDMTDEQLEVARKHIDYHTQLYNYAKPNVDFRKGYIEDLKASGIEDNSVDIVISNCVINLSPQKESVFSEIFRVLKPGGELYFSDVFANRRIPKKLQSDPVLSGECLSGALYTEDFRRIMQKSGWLDYRVVKSSEFKVNNTELEKKIGMIDFTSKTVRAFKVNLEDMCENYGHVAYYQGTIPQARHYYMLDDHHLFKTGLPYPICGNTANMLQQTRFSKHFRIEGDFSIHYGSFDCFSESTNSLNEMNCC